MSPPYVECKLPKPKGSPSPSPCSSWGRCRQTSLSTAPVPSKRFILLVAKLWLLWILHAFYTACRYGSLDIQLLIHVMKLILTHIDYTGKLRIIPHGKTTAQDLLIWIFSRIFGSSLDFLSISGWPLWLDNLISMKLPPMNWDWWCEVSWTFELWSFSWTCWKDPGKGNHPVASPVGMLLSTSWWS